MDAVENALRVIRFDRPEWVPRRLPLHDIRYFGGRHEGFEGGSDLAPAGSRWFDIWNVGWEKEQDDMMGFPKIAPLDTPDKLKRYRWPRPDDPRLVGCLEGQARESVPSERMLCCVHRDTLWEEAYMLVGMENMMVYFYTEPEFAREVLHRIMDFHMGMAEIYMEFNPMVAAMGDDLGTQNSLLLSRSVIDEFLVPEYRRLFQFYKERGVMVYFHSCGHVMPLLDMYISLGVDVLCPVQANANNLEEMIKVTKGRMALDGAISSHTGVTGTPEQLRALVRDTIRLLGRDGGYFCSFDQGLPFPEENVRALEEAVEEYGRYPIG